MTNRAHSWSSAERWNVADTPDLDLAGDDPRYTFQDIAAVARLDSLIVVADGGSAEIRYFGWNGVHRATAGRRGQGPGEFLEFGAVLPVGGDTLLVFDPQQMRLTALSADGRLLFVNRLQLEGQVGHPTLLGRAADGALVLSFSLSAPAGRAGIHRPPTTVVLARLGAQAVETVTTAVGDELEVHFQGASRRSGFRRFGGRLSLAVRDSRVLVATAERPEYREYSPSGALARIVRWSVPEAPFTAAEIQLARRGLADRLGNVDPEVRRRSLESFDAADFPDRLPPYRTVTVDQTGHVWVRTYEWPPGTAPSWRVFDPDGRLLGEVLSPGGLDIRYIGPDYVLGVWRDSLDVEHVRRHHLMRPNRARRGRRRGRDDESTYPAPAGVRSQVREAQERHRRASRCPESPRWRSLA